MPGCAEAPAKVLGNLKFYASAAVNRATVRHVSDGPPSWRGRSETSERYCEMNKILAALVAAAFATTGAFAAEPAKKEETKPAAAAASGAMKAEAKKEEAKKPEVKKEEAKK